MPIVGGAMALVMRAASGSATASSTIANAPASLTRVGVALDRLPVLLIPALRLERAQRHHGLRGEADMAHDGNAALGEEMDGVGHPRSALELDGAAARLLQDARGVAECLLRQFLVGPERHVDDDEGLRGAAHHGTALEDHHVESDGDRGLEPVHDHPETVADKDKIDIRIDDSCRMGVIGRQRDDRLATLAGPYPWRAGAATLWLYRQVIGSSGLHGRQAYRQRGERETSLP